MALLGTFTKAADNSFSGVLRTLTLNVSLTFVPISGPAGELTPTHRILAGEVEVGAAWTKRRTDGRVFYSVKIDDPSFAAPMYATLSQADGAEHFILVWNRPGSARHSAAA